MKIGDKVYIHGYIDEIRKDTVIIRNEGGYFGTVESEINDSVPIEALQEIRKEILDYKDDKTIHAERNEMIDIALEIIDKHLEGIGE